MTGKLKKKIEKHFQVKNTDMQMVTVKKTQFVRLNDKRFFL